jgi:hypothetical protein
MIVLHAGTVVSDLQGSENPDVVKLREVLNSDERHAAVYAALGSVEKQLVSASWLVVAPGKIGTDSFKTSQLVDYITTRSTLQLPAAQVAESLTGHYADSLRAPSSVTVVGFAGIQDYISTLVASCAAVEPLDARLHMRAETVELSDSLIGRVLDNVASTRNAKAAATVASVQDAYASLCLGNLPSASALQILCVLSRWCGII